MNRRAGACLDSTQTSALPKPLDVDLVRDVVLDQDCYDQHEAEHEEAREIVCIFGSLRERAERIVANQRQQQPLPEGDVQPGNAENEERDRVEPMREPLERLEAQHLASRSSRRDAEPSEKEIPRCQRGKRP